jgi:hypothetical protein
MREVHVATSHEEVRQLELRERAQMSKEERLELGGALHAFWVRNYFPNVARLDRTVAVVRRAVR